MFRMICLNLDKKLSFLSVVFMMISIFLIFLITVINSSFDLNDYQLLSNEKIVASNFFFESFQVTEIIAIVFIILLVELELFHNNENFDCYYVALKGKGKYFLVKILSYLIILCFYTLVVFIGIGIIYLIRFNSIEYINFIFNSFYLYLIYLINYCI